MDLHLLKELAVPNDTKIVLCVVDGLGGMPHPETGRSELEAANIPHLDLLAKESLCGLTIPVGYGITPGSGPGHLALFGFDPLVYTVGRGVLEALGVDFDLQPDDVAARGNFCTLDPSGAIVDRRAGRLPTEENARRCAALRDIRLPGVELFIEPVREHRFLLVLRGEGLGDNLPDTDPQREGVPPLPAKGRDPASQRTAALVNQFANEARARLAGFEQGNGLTLRGFAKRPSMPAIGDVCHFRAAAIAVYPMYRGLAKLVGMQVLATGSTFEDEVATLHEHRDAFDFFFIHYKYADSAGEDGNFEAKMAALERFDERIPDLLDFDPDVLMIAGDHATPAVLASHSWHPVPFLMRVKRFAGAASDGADSFNERACRNGSLGVFPAKEALPLAMAYAGRLTKYGA
ncbi:MAG TPA: 2,3-bisphosphoglycerate-independent phosphoglycerate mutase [Dehalococcoidia bacterium]|nr:2,3-bisphosphoglycerate-independent phosphoglycerate mutase [Dehalococcoidia bacterium]